MVYNIDIRKHALFYIDGEEKRQMLNRNFAFRPKLKLNIEFNIDSPYLVHQEHEGNWYRLTFKNVANGEIVSYYTIEFLIETEQVLSPLTFGEGLLASDNFTLYSIIAYEHDITNSGIIFNYEATNTNENIENFYRGFSNQGHFYDYEKKVYNVNEDWEIDTSNPETITISNLIGWSQSANYTNKKNGKLYVYNNKYYFGVFEDNYNKATSYGVSKDKFKYKIDESGSIYLEEKKLVGKFKAVGTESTDYIEIYMSKGKQQILENFSIDTYTYRQGLTKINEFISLPKQKKRFYINNQPIPNDYRDFITTLNPHVNIYNETWKKAKYIESDNQI